MVFAPLMWSALKDKPSILEFNGPEVPSRKWWNPGKYTWWTPLASAVEDLLTEKCDFIVTVSDVLREYLKEVKGRGRNVLVNPNGFDEEEFSRQVNVRQVRDEWKIPVDRKVVTHVSTFARFHGTAVLARCAVKILSRRKDVFFLFVGDGTERKEVEKILTGFESHYKITGIVPHSEAVRLMMASDLLVSSHLGGENFLGSPTKIFEYMASGVPVVATAVGQVARLIRNGENGVLVSPGNVEELAGAIERLIDNPEEGRRMASAARKEAFDRYTWTAHVERIISYCSGKTGI